MSRRYKHVIDNHDTSLYEFLHSSIGESDIFRIVSAYFSIYGFELLESQLQSIRNTRFLFGDPDSVGSLDPGEAEPKSFELIESKLSPRTVLVQKHLAQRCAEWVRQDRVKVRSVRRQGFLHGKLYHSEADVGNFAVVGSSNFTRRGLGGGEDPNIEINLAIDSDSELKDLRDWFDDLWHDEERTIDAKSDVLDALARVGRDYAPEIIYFKTLFELFQEDLEAFERRKAESTQSLSDTVIWNSLYDFQKDAANTVIRRLETQGGCILADSVGLGKTYTALAVIKYYELQFNAKVLVLCPKKLNGNWVIYPYSNSYQGNPFAEDRFGFTVLSHTDLSRYEGPSGNVELSQFDWSGFHLVVIDESHNFRNATASRTTKDGSFVKLSRYERLMRDVIVDGGETKVLMLSATPVNTSITDLRNQIQLLVSNRDTAFRDSLGIHSIRNLLDATQRKFRVWEEQKPRPTRAQLVEDMGSDFFNLLGSVSIARSRRQIKQFYANTLQSIGEFPSHEPPDNRYPPTDLQGQLSYRHLYQLISQFRLAIYSPTNYLVGKEALKELEEEKKQYHFNQRDRERFLIGMIRTNFLKRLESSAYSLALTLERTIAKIEDLRSKVIRFNEGKSVDLDTLPDDEEDDDEFLIDRGRRPFHLKDIDTDRWLVDLVLDKETLETVLNAVRAISSDRDGKLAELIKDVRNRVSHPTSDNEGRKNRKLIVFTTFKDTAEYIYANLSPIANELGLRIALVAGDEILGRGSHNLMAVLSQFAPLAHGLEATDDDIDLLIATDCISEGQNLQDCDTVLNYDIHWNPVRLIQRFGRIDRLGSKSKSVRMINYWPTDDMELYLNLRNRVHARMVLADAAATGDENNLDEQEQHAEAELNFRDQQLMQLRREIVELEDLNDGLSISDFTLDYFLAQLLRYLESHRDVLESIPLGAYAISKGPQDGIVFVLRQLNAPDDSSVKSVSPLMPFFLVFIRRDGTITANHKQAKRVLEIFENVAARFDMPLQDLCDAFDRETERGRNMEEYDALLREVISSIAQGVQSEIRNRIGKRGSPIPKLNKQPNDDQDFELITWLIIRKTSQD